MFRNMKIGRRLGLGFGLVLALMFAITYVGINAVRSMNDMTNRLVTRELRMVTNGSQFTNLASENYRNKLEMILAADAAQSAKVTARIQVARKETNETMERLKSLVDDEEGRRLLARMEETRKPYTEVSKKGEELSSKGMKSEATAVILGEARPLFETYSRAMAGFVAYQEKKMGEATGRAEATYESNRNQMLAIGSLGLLAGIVSGVWITRRVSRPLATALRVADQVALGDLSAQFEITNRDETGLLLESMRNMVGSLKGIASAAERMSNGDMSAHVEPRSEVDVLGRAFQRLAATMKELVAETGTLVESARAGDLRKRGNAGNFQGSYRDMVEGFNRALDNMSAPVEEASAALHKIAARDLDVMVSGNYQGDFASIKTALNTAVTNLQNTLSRILAASGQVSEASKQISSGSQSLAQGASEQAGSLEEVSSSLQELSSGTRQNAANSQQARGLTDAARQSAGKGVESMTRLSEAINRIRTSAAETAKIVKTIDEIAFQTNLLALNAAVEAARAGDAGRGFAVVAEEVRNLAIRSAEAAKNTSRLIDESIKNSECGVAINLEVLQDLRQIDEQVRRVSEVMKEIATASEEQNHGVEQLNATVEQMNQVTQQTAASAEESASAAEELAGQAAEMESLVNSFTLGVVHEGAEQYRTPLLPRPSPGRKE